MIISYKSPRSNGYISMVLVTMKSRAPKIYGQARCW